MPFFPFHCSVIQHVLNCHLPVSSIAVSKYHTCNNFSLLQVKRLKRTRKCLSTKSEKSYYEVLELSPKATHAQIKEAYYKLSRKYHPDQQPGNERASENFRVITEAYEVLINLQKKKLYDKGLYQGKAGPLTSADVATSSKARSQPQTSSQQTSAFSVDQWHQDRYKELINVKLQQDAMVQRRKSKQDVNHFKRGSFFIMYIFMGVIFAYYKVMPYISEKLPGSDSKAR